MPSYNMKIFGRAVDLIYAYQYVRPTLLYQHRKPSPVFFSKNNKFYLLTFECVLISEQKCQKIARVNGSRDDAYACRHKVLQCFQLIEVISISRLRISILFSVLF